MQGQATDIKIHAERILKLRDKLDKILAENTGQPIEKIKADTERDFSWTRRMQKRMAL